MSHKTTIKEVQVTDVNVLRAAVQRMNEKMGVKCELRENAKMRSYYEDKSTYPLVLSLQEGKYDVGFEKNENGAFNPVYDSFNGYVKRILGADNEDLAKLKQAYSCEMARKNALQYVQRNPGYTLSETTDSTGRIHLRLTNQ